MKPKQPASALANLASENLTQQLSSMGVRCASASADESTGISKLDSGIKCLDDFLEGGLPVGAISEWGVPLGRGGREILLTWLARHFNQEAVTRCTEQQAAHQTVYAGENPRWALWIYSRTKLTIYPPAWLARGVSLKHTRFVCSCRPLVDLKPVFLSPLFQIIVLDAPDFFTEDDCAFLARQARKNRQTIILLRDFFLSPKRGNVWAKLRLNSYFNETTQEFCLDVVRGLPPRKLSINPAVLKEQLSWERITNEYAKYHNLSVSC